LQQTISFTIENIGTFKAKESLSIIEEAQLEREIDEFFNNQYYEIKKRQTDLAETEQGKNIKTRLQIVEIIFELNKAITERPETMPANVGDLKDHAILVKIWNEYQKKKQGNGSA
jgi:hypothetical protein